MAARAEAVAVWRGRIIKVGTDAEVRQLAGPRTQVIDLKGRRVVPGFYDSHLHLVGGGSSLSQVALKDAKDEAEFGRRLDYYTGFVFEMYATRKAARPIVGGGRYDRLVSLLAKLRHETAVTVPAVGFSIWLDRIGAAP